MPLEKTGEGHRPENVLAAAPKPKGKETAGIPERLREKAGNWF